jgi:hypothetical protein
MDAWGDEARVIPFQDAARESGRATKMYGTYGEGPRAACLGHRGGPTSKQKHRGNDVEEKQILLTQVCGGPTSSLLGHARRAHEQAKT